MPKTKRKPNRDEAPAKKNAPLPNPTLHQAWVHLDPLSDNPADHTGTVFLPHQGMTLLLRSMARQRLVDIGIRLLAPVPRPVVNARIDLTIGVVANNKWTRTLKGGERQRINTGLLCDGQGEPTAGVLLLRFGRRAWEEFCRASGTEVAGPWLHIAVAECTLYLDPVKPDDASQQARKFRKALQRATDVAIVELEQLKARLAAEQDAARQRQMDLAAQLAEGAAALYYLRHQAPPVCE
jgi:hypothetical protein